MATRFLSFPDVTLADPNPDLPLKQTYAAAFAALSGFLGWFDLTDSALVTVSSGKVTNVDAKAGTGDLVQATDARRPTWDGGEVSFAAASSQVLSLSGLTFPTGSHTVAVVFRHGSWATTENIVGISTPTATRHNQFFNTGNSKLRYAVGTSFADVTPPAANVKSLAIMDFDTSSQAVRHKLNGLDGDGGIGAADSPLTDAFYVGAALSTGANGFTGQILDVFLFSGAQIGSEAETLIENYARNVRGVSV